MHLKASGTWKTRCIYLVARRYSVCILSHGTAIRISCLYQLVTFCHHLGLPSKHWKPPVKVNSSLRYRRCFGSRSSGLPCASEFPYHRSPTWLILLHPCRPPAVIPLCKMSSPGKSCLPAVHVAASSWHPGSSTSFKALPQPSRYSSPPSAPFLSISAGFVPFTPFSNRVPKAYFLIVSLCYTGSPIEKASSVQCPARCDA